MRPSRVRELNYSIILSNSVTLYMEDYSPHLGPENWKASGERQTLNQSSWTKGNLVLRAFGVTAGKAFSAFPCTRRHNLTQV